MSHGALDHILEISVRLSSRISLGQAAVPELPAPLLRLEPAELMTHLDQTFGASGPLEQVRRELWHQAVTRAHLARALGLERGLDPRLCFTLGLLSELGLLLAVACAEQVVLERGTPVPPWTALWARLVRPQARRLAQQAYQRWGVPRALRDLLETGAEDVPRYVSEAAALLHTVDQLQQLARSRSGAELDAAELAQVPGVAVTELRALQRAMARVPSVIGQLPSELRRAGLAQLSPAPRAATVSASAAGAMDPASTATRPVPQWAAA